MTGKPDNQALQEANERFQAMADGTPVMIWVTDTTGRIEFVNRAYRDFFGVTVAQIQSQGWQPLVHPDDLAGYAAAFADSLRERELFHAQTRVINANGDWRWIDSHGQPRFSESGELLGMVGSSFEITERRKAEQGLAESERRYRELIQYAPTAIYEIDYRTGKFVAVNDSMLELTGYSREELLNMHASDLLDEQGKAQFQERASQWLQGHAPDESVEYRIRAKDGHYVYAVLSATFTRDAAGQPRGAAVVAHDITQRKLVEQALRQSEEKYHALFDSMDEGFCLIEMLFDASGRPIDYRFLETNRAFIHRTGLQDAVGKRMKALVPGHEQHWFDTYGQVAITGQPIRFINEARHLHRWYDVYAFRLGKPEEHKVAILFQDITGQWQNEMALKAAAVRDAFLVKLSDALRPLADPIAIQAEASRVLGEHLRADQVSYIEVEGDYAIVEREYNLRGKTSLVRRHRYNDFGEEVIQTLKAGQTLVIDDTSQHEFSEAQRATFATLEVGALVNVPLIKDGKWVAAVGVYSEQPRRWMEDELNLIRETAERTWATLEQARAEVALRQSEAHLRESEERFRSSIESLNEAFMVFSAVRSPEGKIVDFRWEYVNHAVSALYQRDAALVIGHTILELFPEQDEMGLIDRYRQVVETGQPSRERLHYQNDGGAGPLIQGIFDIRASKFGDGLIVTANDITEQMQRDAEHQRIIQEREIHHRLAEQREMERQSYARDIHDGPIQTLSSLTFNLQYLRETYPDPTLKLELDQISLGIKAAVQELRQVMNELRPPTVIRFGLAKAIQMHAEALRERQPQIEWNLRLTADGQLLPEQTCLAMFRIYQEAVSNVIRHAQASKVWVLYRLGKEHVTLEIRDNGVGFAEKQDIVRLTSSQHFGLAGIIERVEAINGMLEIQSQPGQGTSIKVRVPLRPKDEDTRSSSQ